jgi:glycosyltransferase involved in cell wall biosynthesis
MNRLKVLFVAHTPIVGGAARSLRELLEGYDDADFDLAVPRLRRATDDQTLRSSFGRRIRRIHRFWLPFEMCYRGQSPWWMAPHMRVLPPLLWRATRAQFYRFVCDERYDVVHLNSLVLHSMVRRDLPFVLHVREIVSNDHARVRRSLADARGVVFIDDATRAPFADVALRSHTILNNPVDMTGIGALPADAAARLGGDPARLVIFAIIGDLIPEKGVDFVIETFRQVHAPDARLLVVGSGPRGFEAELRRLAAGDPRVVFWGRDREIVKVFTLADYVLRGEAYPCVGRTIYEALYAGCGAIVPGDAANHKLFEYDRFKHQIHFYAPRDGARLKAVFEQLAGHKRADKVGGSNVVEYVRAFDRFLRDATGIT